MSTTKPREIPALFNTQMVQAIANGKKTQTRRPVNNLPGFGKICQLHKSTTPGYDWQFRCKRGLWQDFRHDEFMKLLAKFGRVGDRLWVRETFCGYIQTSHEYDEWEEATTEEIKEQYPMTIEYYATSESHPDKWRPSIHMPRWASRFLLEITDVRLQRLSDVTNEEAEAEGFSAGHLGNSFEERPFIEGCTISSLGTSVSAAGMFEMAWDELYGNAEDNPVMIARTFKVLDGTDGK